MSRRDGAAVARWVAERVQEVAPPGLGRWAPAWDLVEPPSMEFLDALARWEESGTVEDREAARAAAGDVVKAWREAAQLWEATGRSLKRTPAEPCPAEVAQ